MNIFDICFILSFLSPILCQLTNDTALVWTGESTDNEKGFGVMFGNPSVYLQRFSENNFSSKDSYRIKWLTWSYRFCQAITYDARRQYIGLADINFKELIFYDINDISKGEIKYPKYYFGCIPLSSNVLGLAFASNFNLFYWADATFQYIGVLNFETSQWTKIATITSGVPSSVAVHEKKKLIFWSVLRGEPKIERSNLFGGDRTVIVNENLLLPVNLVVDKQTEKLFWLDGVLKSCDINGKNIETYLYNVPLFLHSSFAIYKDIVIFSTDTGDFDSYKISQGNYLKNISSFINKNISTIYSISLDSKEFVSYYPNPCANNTCQHLCFPINDANYICKCSYGFTLGSDGKSCKPGVLKAGWLLVGDRNGGIVYQVDPGSQNIETIVNLNIYPYFLTNMAYSYNYIYYVHGDQQNVMQYNISTKGTELFYRTSSNITDIVVDQKTGDVYVANVYGQIYKVTSSGNDQIFVNDRTLYIRKLYIHPTTRRFFFSDCNTKTVIEMDIQSHMQKDTIQTDICIDSMDFDFEDNYAYYGDNGNKVWRQNLNRRTDSLLEIFRGSNYIWDVTSNKDNLFIVQNSHDIVQLEKKSLMTSTLIQHAFRNASEMIIVSKSDNLLQKSSGSSVTSLCLVTSLLLVSTNLWSMV